MPGGWWSRDARRRCGRSRAASALAGGTNGRVNGESVAATVAAVGAHSQRCQGGSLGREAPGDRGVMWADDDVPAAQQAVVDDAGAGGAAAGGRRIDGVERDGVGAIAVSENARHG